MTRAAVLGIPPYPPGSVSLPLPRPWRPSVGVELSPVNARDPDEIERDIARIRALWQWRSDRDSERIGSGFYINLIITLAARHKLPAVYWDRPSVASGGLISYGSDDIDQFRRAAGYVDRVLRGEKPADLPCRLRTKYELVINLKTAKALGADCPAPRCSRGPTL